MKKITLLIILISFFGFGQSKKKQISEIHQFQKELNEEYRNPEKSPLRGEHLKNFKQHPFFPIDLKHRVTAEIIRTENSEPFEMPTSSGKTKRYREFGKLHFVLNGKKQTLTIYQNLTLIKQKGYEDYLFLPFRDATNGNETYGGGRYLDVRIPEGKKIVIDFNRSYHPYCAYNAYDYSCPVVPDENRLEVPIRAGVKYEDIYFH